MTDYGVDDVDDDDYGYEICGFLIQVFFKKPK